MEKEKKLPPLTIQVDVYWYEDEEGNIIIDEEEMQKDFEYKLEQIIKPVYSSRH